MKTPQDYFDQLARTVLVVVCVAFLLGYMLGSRVTLMTWCSP